MVRTQVPGAAGRSPVRPGSDLKRLVAALVGFGAGWSARQYWTRLNTPVPDSPVFRPASHEEWVRWVAHYPGPFYEGPIGEWVGDLPIVQQRTEAREELGLPPWEDRHGTARLFHDLPHLRRFLRSD